jgi:hypothetical protein
LSTKRFCICTRGKAEKKSNMIEQSWEEETKSNKQQATSITPPLKIFKSRAIQSLVLKCRKRLAMCGLTRELRKKKDVR